MKKYQIDSLRVRASTGVNIQLEGKPNIAVTYDTSPEPIKGAELEIHLGNYTHIFDKSGRLLSSEENEGFKFT